MIRILDSTLREGEQAPGLHFSLAAKLRIAALLDEVGVDVIEAGNPTVDPKIAEAVGAISRLGLRAQIGAHARCRIPDVDRALASAPQFLGIFLSVSEQRLARDYQLTFAQALAEIRLVLAHARAARPGLEIRFTIEDASRTPLAPVLETAVAAVEAGADIISLADTTGCSSPFTKERSLGRMVKKLREEFERENLLPQIETHCHNDRGLALANALDACRNGAQIIDASVLGLGERAGIVDLAELMNNLRETFGAGPHWNFVALGRLYEFVSLEARVPIPAHWPLMGANAFTHCAGVHAKAVAQDPASYQSVRPEALGRSAQFALGLQSGKASIAQALRRIGRADLIQDQDLVARLLAEVKSHARDGATMTLEQDFPALVGRLLGE